MRQQSERRVHAYTQEEDEAIFDGFWDVSGRKGLAERLGRPLRGVTYRFYQILREKGMTPHDYLKLKAQERTGAGTDPEQPWSWTKEYDMRLWRLLKSGTSMDGIVDAMEGPSMAECERRVKYLERLNRKEEKAQKAADAAIGAVATGARKRGRPPGSGKAKAVPVVEPLFEGSHTATEGDGLLGIIASLPDRINRMEERLSRLEGAGATADGDILTALANGILGLQRNSGGGPGMERLAAMEAEKAEAIARAEREMEAARREREELQQVYKELEVVLHQFMNLSSVDKLRVLGDFSTRLCTTVDRFGMVVNTRTVLG